MSNKATLEEHMEYAAVHGLTNSELWANHIKYLPKPRLYYSVIKREFKVTFEEFFALARERNPHLKKSKAKKAKIVEAVDPSDPDNTIFIGLDISPNKPAVCLLYRDKIMFFAYPHNFTTMGETNKVGITHSGMRILHDHSKVNYKLRDVEEPSHGKPDVVCDVIMARELAEMIRDDIIKAIKNRPANVAVKIKIEGLKYSGFVNYKTFPYHFAAIEMMSYLGSVDIISPSKVKKTAGVVGTDKHRIITRFKIDGPDCELRDTLRNTDLLKNRGGKNYIKYVDDLVDAYFIAIS